MTKISEQYGVKDEAPEERQPLTEATKEFDVKTQGKQFAHIKSGRETIDVARGVYVKELEQRIATLEKDNKRAEADIRRLKTHHDALARELKELRKALNGKMDKFN